VEIRLYRAAEAFVLAFGRSRLVILPADRPIVDR